MHEKSKTVNSSAKKTKWNTSLWNIFLMHTAITSLFFNIL